MIVSGLRVSFPDGTEYVEAPASKLEIFAYEDAAQESSWSMFDDSGAPKLKALYRLAWVFMRLRHEEKRDFEKWVEEADPEVGLAYEAADPTGGEQTIPLDEESPVSPSEPESIPEPSSTSTRASSARSKQKPTKPASES